MISAVEVEPGSTVVKDLYVKRRAPAQRAKFETPENTTFFRSANRIHPNNVWLRQITKIVRHLRDDMARIHPNEVMPSTWMIKCLLASMPKPEFNTMEVNQFAVTDEQWDKSLQWVMQNLADRTQSDAKVRKTFFELDSLTPLFPNQELFSPRHANRFALLILDYLEKNLAKC